MKAKKKNLTRRQKLARGIEKPSGNSKYGKKITQQARGVFGSHSPFTVKNI